MQEGEEDFLPVSRGPVVVQEGEEPKDEVDGLT